MSAAALATYALLVIGVAAAFVAGAGAFATRRALDRLHYGSLASTTAPAAIAAAVLLHEGLSLPGLKALVVTLLLLAQGPVITHAMGRAIESRHRDRAAARQGRERERP